MNKKQLQEMALVQGWEIDSFCKTGGNVEMKLPNGRIYARLTKKSCSDRAYKLERIQYSRFDCLNGNKYIEIKEAKELAKLFPEDVSISCIGASSTVIR